MPFKKIVTFLLCQGLTLPTIKHHVALQPLFVIMGAGIIFVAMYVGRSVTDMIFVQDFVFTNCRLASKTTDVNWGKQKDHDKLHEYYNNRQFKWFNPRGVDYSHLSDNRPNYRD